MVNVKRSKAAVKQEPVLLRIDIGCGKNKKEGFIGVDKLAFNGVDHVIDVTRKKLPFTNNSVDEVYTSHFIEHLTSWERVILINELYRVMKPGAKCTLITPHWGSCRAYGDPTHQWPPMSEFWFYYLSKKWRDENAPHTDIEHEPRGFNCDFDATWGGSLHNLLGTRNSDFQQHAMQFYKEAVQDIIATLTKKVSE